MIHIRITLHFFCYILIGSHWCALWLFCSLPYLPFCALHSKQLHRFFDTLINVPRSIWHNHPCHGQGLAPNIPHNTVTNLPGRLPDRCGWEIGEQKRLSCSRWKPHNMQFPKKIQKNNLPQSKESKEDFDCSIFFGGCSSYPAYFNIVLVPSHLTGTHSPGKIPGRGPTTSQQPCQSLVPRLRLFGDRHENVKMRNWEPWETWDSGILMDIQYQKHIQGLVNMQMENVPRCR